ncbi:hypothetical protein [Paenibacillus sp. NPDC058174]|uniref:hypothetical protein n=1 Tax=Paenibacillus sp. NPDC058174 TaxID=3346366 RepID=UPI0036DCFF90
MAEPMDLDLDEYEEPRWKTVLWILLYSLVCGLLLMAFSLIASIVKFVFSLAALFLIIRFFKRYERWGARGAFIALTVVFYFLSAVIAAFFIYMQQYGGQ